jgi:hypothetical protein
MTLAAADNHGLIRAFGPLPVTLVTGISGMQRRRLARAGRPQRLRPGHRHRDRRRDRAAADAAARPDRPTVTLRSS